MRPLIILLLWSTAAMATDYIPTPLPTATRTARVTITTPAAVVPAPPKEEAPAASLLLDRTPKGKPDCQDGSCLVDPPAGPTVSIACPDLVQAGDLVVPAYVNDRTVHHAGLWWYRQSNAGDPARWVRQAAPGSRSWTQHRDPEPARPIPAAQPAASPCWGGHCTQPDAAEFWAPRGRRR